MKHLVFWMLTAMIVLSCSESGPRPESLIGWYRVSLSAVDNHEGKDNQVKQRKETGHTPGNNQQESGGRNNEEEDYRDIDTSTFDGKIRYSTRQFEKSMKALEKNVSSLAEELSDVFSSVAESGIMLRDGLLEDITFDAELQQDGDIKIREMPLDFFQVRDATWEVKGKHFYILRGNSDTLVFDIIKKSKDQVLLKNKDVALTLDRIK